MHFSAKDLVDAHLANSEPDANARPVTPEPTTQSGVEPENALYDTPEDGSKSTEFRDGRRKRRSTERGGRWVENFNRSEQIRKKGNRTRKINSARRSHAQQSHTQRNDGTQGPTNTQSNPGSTHARPSPKPLPRRKQRGRSRKACDLSRSPTPGSTDHELEEPTQPQTNNPQYTYIYETLDHEGLVQYVQENYGIDVRGCDTQTILAKARVAEVQQTTRVGSPRQPPSVNPLPGIPFQVGGGWHHNFTASQSQSMDPRGTKRGPDTSRIVGGSNKRQRAAQAPVEDTVTEPETGDELPEPQSMDLQGTTHGLDTTKMASGSNKAQCAAQAPAEDTATESETEDELPTRPVRIAAERILGACPGPSLDRRPDPARPSAPGTHPPPPSRESTATTVPASRSLGSQYGKSITPLPIPTLVSPVRGPVHSRLRAKALQRFFDHTDHNAEAAKTTHQGAPAPSANEDIDELAPTDTEDILETDVNPPSTVPQCTYNGTRTHLLSQPQATPAEPNNDVDPILNPNSPNLTSAELIQRERRRAIAAKALAEVRELTGGQRRPHIFTEATSAPITRPQPCPPPGTSVGAPGARVRGARRLDPAGAARADMIAFNEACTRGEATSFVQSVTRHSKRTARCAAPYSRPLDGYLEDDEELLAQAEAFAKKKWPDSSPPIRGRNRKQKPLARDISGVDRQVLIVAKVHFFAYALTQGVYQTRATFLRWAESVHYATWQMELPTTPYVRQPPETFEIMVNSVATFRGKVKERVRPFAADTAGFQQRQSNQQVIQENLRIFNLLYPNNFHCKTYCPRKGHYENPEIAHCIAVALFHGPGSVGLMFPDYFGDMPLTVVAFALVIWQFCIEEWANGWHQNGDLGMVAMREKYEATLAGLKELRDIAPRRMERLQREWRDYIVEYSGARLTGLQEGQTEAPRQSEMRPDTPDPEAEAEIEAGAEATPAIDPMSIEELNAQLFETGRQASLQQRVQELAALEESEDRPGTPMDEDEDAGSCAPASHSQPPSLPPIEYDTQGRLTARSKGKGRAN